MALPRESYGRKLVAGLPGLFHPEGCLSMASRDGVEWDESESELEDDRLADSPFSSRGKVLSKVSVLRNASSSEA